MCRKVAMHATNHDPRARVDRLEAGSGSIIIGLTSDQLCGAPPLDATEAIAKAMAAQRGDFVGGYKMLPPLPTFNLPNLNLQSRQEESGMTAGSRDNLPAPLSCAAPPVHALLWSAVATTLASVSTLSRCRLRGPVNTLVPPFSTSRRSRSEGS
jgi:hypothetical protein